MITKTINLYTFDELSEEAKDVARDWFRQGNDGSQPWEYIQEDAKTVGLRICSLDQHRANNGTFDKGAVYCATQIVGNHGETCETHKTARAFLHEFQAIEERYPEDDDGYRDREGDAMLDEAEENFLNDILEDYRIMLEKEIEYENSDAVVDENILVNGYTFREDGKRED